MLSWLNDDIQEAPRTSKRKHCEQAITKTETDSKQQLATLVGDALCWLANRRVQLERDICYHNETIDGIKAVENTAVLRSVVTDRTSDAMLKVQQKLDALKKDAAACGEGTSVCHLAARRLMCFTG